MLLLLSISILLIVIILFLDFIQYIWSENFEYIKTKEIKKKLVKITVI